MSGVVCDWGPTAWPLRIQLAVNVAPTNQFDQTEDANLNYFQNQKTELCSHTQFGSNANSSQIGMWTNSRETDSGHYGRTKNVWI